MEDLSQRTETDSTFANPDGTWSTDAAPEPFRVRDNRGAWHDIDTTLEHTSAGLKPKYAASDLVLSDGGDKQFASLTEGGKNLDWSWPSVLPTPEVDGNVAIYKDVVPGGDLVVTALSTGFSHDIVLNEAPKAPITITTPIATDGAAVVEDQSDGSLSVTTKSGDELVSADQPKMYDASIDSRTDEPTNIIALDTSVGKTAEGVPTVTLDPDKGFLADPSTQYPVTIDPSWTSWVTGDTWVMNTDQPSSTSTDEYLRVGSTDGGAHKRRTFIHYDVTKWNGRHILSAQMVMRNVNSASCTAGSTLVQRVTAQWTAPDITWSNQPSATATGQSSFAPAYGVEPGCSNNDANWDVTPIVQYWAAHPDLNYGVRILPNSETGSNSYRAYDSANFNGGNDPYRPHINFTYNTVPGIPTTPTVAPYGSYTAPGTSTATTYVGSTTPSFSAKASDSDNGNLKQTFEVSTTSGGSPVATCVTRSAAQGSTGTCAIPSASALNNGGTYYVRAKSSDGTDDSTWSAPHKFTVSIGTPLAPTISCPTQGNGAWTATVPGGTVSCTITATSSVTGTQTGWIDYIIGNGTEQRKLITVSADPAVAKTTITVPATEGRHTITSRAESVGGVKSDPVTYAFGFGTHVGLDAPADGPPTVTTGGVTIAASGPPVASGESTPTAHAQWRLAGSGLDQSTGWTDAAPGSTNLGVTKSASGSIAVSGVWDSSTATGSGLDARVSALLDVQVCIDYAAGTHCSWEGTHRQINRVPHAFGDNFPTADAGDGQVALWTGEFATSDTDATLAAGDTTLSISRDASTFAGAATSTASGVFGPGWTASLDGPDGGDADLRIIDRTRADGTIVAIDGGGTTMTFAPSGPFTRRSGAAITTGTWDGVDDNTIDSGITAAVTGTGTSTQFTLTELDGTTTVFAIATAASAPSISHEAVFVPSAVTEAGELGSTIYSYDSQGRVTRILAPVPSGVTCPASGTLPAGCRALTISYATTTTATSSTLGNVTGQVDGISSVIGATTTVLATYSYGLSGNLRRVTDPRDNLTTNYTYDDDRIASIQQPGLIPTNYAYGGSDHRLSRITRDRPGTGTGTATLATVIYGVPTTGGAGLPNMNATNLSVWGQTALPTYSAAVFGPDLAESTLDPAQVPAADWAAADLFYTDARGYTVNTASNGAGGWQLSDTEYNADGNPVRELDEGDIDAIRTGQIAPSAAGTLTTYNPTHTNAAGEVTLPAGTEVTDTYDTARWVTLSDGTLVLARPHTHTEYDQGAPHSGINPNTGQEYGLPTTETDTAADPSTLATLDTQSVTMTSYADAVPANADLGWSMGLAGTVTQVMDPSGAPGSSDIANRTRYDARGRVVAELQPKSNGTDVGTRTTTYYTADASGGATCGSKPAWAGTVCQTGYAGAPSSGPALPTTTVTYNEDQLPLVTTEAVAGTSRTITMGYRADDQPASKTVRLTGMSGSTPVPDLAYAYDAATGLPTTTTASGTGAGAPISVGYDTWGRQISYSAAAGEVTTTTYDSADRVATVADPQGTATYAYDGTDAAGLTEHRGMTTGVTYSRPSGDVTITGAYDANGTLIRQNFPGGIIQRTEYDPAGEQTGLSYSGQVTTTADGTAVTTAQDQIWLAWSEDNDAEGRVRRDWTPSGASLDGSTGTAASGYAREYRYDRGSRLVGVTDKTAIAGTGVVSSDDPTNSAPTNCQIRTYGFDRNGNRTSLARTPAAADGSCQSGTSPSGVVTKTWTFDTADRLTGSYAYDNLGRATTIPQADTPAASGAGNPGALTLGYYDDDSARTITQGGQTTTYSIDSAGRRVTAASGPSNGSATSSIVRHYSDDTDDPGWSTTTTSGSTTTERILDDLKGDLGFILVNSAVRLPLADPHGDTVSQITLPISSNATAIDSWQDTDEYGLTLTGVIGATPTNSGGSGIGYGWLGANQRATDNFGLLLMGARLYSSSTGQFTSVDPVYGGNTTAYSYPQDPVGSTDLDGQCWCQYFHFHYHYVGAFRFHFVRHWYFHRVRHFHHYVRSFVHPIASGYLWAHKKRTPAKNSGRQGHRKGNNTEKHSKAQGHGGRKNPRYKK